MVCFLPQFICCWHLPLSSLKGPYLNKERKLFWIIWPGELSANYTQSSEEEVLLGACSAQLTNSYKQITFKLNTLFYHLLLLKA